MTRYKSATPIILVAFLVLALISFLVITNINRTPQEFSTPDLIQLAVANEEITEGEGLLYLAYALGDYEKLPTQFHSNIPWSGTMIGLQLYETVKSKAELCKLSPFIQSELRRILDEGVMCEK